VWDFNSGVKYDMSKSSDVSALVEAVVSGKEFSSYVSEDAGESFYNYDLFRKEQKAYLTNLLVSNDFTVQEFRQYIKDNAVAIMSVFDQFKRNLMYEELAEGETLIENCIFQFQEHPEGYFAYILFFDNYGMESDDISEIQVTAGGNIVGNIPVSGKSILEKLPAFEGTEFNLRLITDNGKDLGDKKFVIEKTVCAAKSKIDSARSEYSAFLQEVTVALNDYSGMPVFSEGFSFDIYRNRDLVETRDLTSSRTTFVTELLGGSNEFRYVLKKGDDVCLENSIVAGGEHLVYLDIDKFDIEFLDAGEAFEGAPAILRYRYIGNLSDIEDLNLAGSFRAVCAEYSFDSLYIPEGEFEYGNSTYVDFYYEDLFLFRVEAV
jgi:hypothetical protein